MNYSMMNVVGSSLETASAASSPSVLTTVGLPVALGIIMLGLGLSLTPKDFTHVAKHPKAVTVALSVQLLVLPLVCFGLVYLFQLPPILAVGMMLLAASPGGSTANLYSHLFRGDVALNISLTALNSVIAVFTLPLIVNLSIAHFVKDGAQLGLQLDKVLEVFAIVLLPVFLGMLIRRWKPDFAKSMDKPVRIVSGVILAVVIAGAVATNLDLFMKHFVDLSLITVLFCILSLTIGFYAAKLFKLKRGQAIASSFEMGIHNATLAIVIAQTVLLNDDMSLPSAIYGVLMFFVALGFGFIIRKGEPAADAEEASSVTVSQQ